MVAESTEKYAAGLRVSARHACALVTISCPQQRVMMVENTEWSFCQDIAKRCRHLIIGWRTLANERCLTSNQISVGKAAEIQRGCDDA